MGKTITIAILAVSLGISLLVNLSLGLVTLVAAKDAGWLDGGMGAPLNPYTTPTGIAPQISYPPRVTLGDAFDIQLIITNTATHPQHMLAVDITSGFLDGIEIVSTDPGFTRIQDNGDYQSYFIEKDIAPGQSLALTFHAKAIQPGDFAADFDSCIDTPNNWTTNMVGIAVDPR